MSCLLKQVALQPGYETSDLDFAEYKPLADGFSRYGLSLTVKERRIVADPSGLGIASWYRTPYVDF